MKLPNIRNSKYTIAGLSAGLILGGAGLAVAVTSDNTVAPTSTTRSTATDQPTAQPETGSSSQPVTDSTTAAPTGSNTIPGVTPNSGSTPTNSPSPATSSIVPAPTVVGVDEAYQPSATPGNEDLTCTYRMSDGTNQTKFGGSVNAEARQAGKVAIGCSATP